MDEPAQNNGQSENSSQTVTQDAPDNSNTVGAAVEAITQGMSGYTPTTAPTPSDDNSSQSNQNYQQTQSRQGYQPTPRVYDGLSPEEVNMFKNMSNRAYEALYPHYVETRNWKQEKAQLTSELEKIRNASFYEDENAYQVAPEYQQLSGVVQSLSGEASFWQNQLNAIEAGQPYSVLIQNADGKVQVHGPITEYSQGEARAQVLGALTKANALHNQYATQLSSFGESYKTKYSGAKKSLEQTEAQIFAGADMKKLDSAAESKMKMFPSEIRSVPVRTLARALVIIDGLIAMNKRMNGNQVSNTIKQNISRAAGPTNGQFQAGTNKGNTVGNVMDDFKRAKAMGQI